MAGSAVRTIAYSTIEISRHFIFAGITRIWIHDIFARSSTLEKTVPLHSDFILGAFFFLFFFKLQELGHNIIIIVNGKLLIKNSPTVPLTTLIRPPRFTLGDKVKLIRVQCRPRTLATIWPVVKEYNNNYSL